MKDSGSFTKMEKYWRKPGSNSEENREFLEEIGNLLDKIGNNLDKVWLYW
jgi:hypothetical protein